MLKPVLKGAFKLESQPFSHPVLVQCRAEHPLASRVDLEVPWVAPDLRVSTRIHHTARAHTKRRQQAVVFAGHRRPDAVGDV